MLENVKLTLSVLMSFVIWTSVLALGILTAVTFVRILVAGGLTTYQWMHF